MPKTHLYYMKSYLAWYFKDNMLFPKLNYWFLHCPCTKAKANYKNMENIYFVLIWLNFCFQQLQNKF